MFISREKFEQMEYELKQEKVDKEFWHMMSNNWKDTSTDYRSRYKTSEKFADDLIMKKGELEGQVEHLKGEFRRLSIENESLRSANSNLYTDYLDTLDENDLLQDSLSLSIEALKESQKQINILKQAKDILSDDLNKAKYERDYYKELYYREGGY